jgi:hypothetical protein
MHKYSLTQEDGHIFIELEGRLWLFDTGAPESFGRPNNLTVADKHFFVGESYLGLSDDTLSKFVGVECSGLLGADVLGHFDHILAVENTALTVSTDELSHLGQSVQLELFMGIPIVTATVVENDYRMFFDTGAQISYLQNDSLTDFPFLGSVSDFYPGIGQFQTDTYKVPVSFSGVKFSLRCGTLPSLLGMTLMMAGTQGIIGNAILSNRTVGYFPRRRLLSI